MLILRVSGAVLSMLVALVLARVMGREDFGEYTYITSWAFLLFLPATFGADRIVLRHAWRIAQSRKVSGDIAADRPNFSVVEADRLLGTSSVVGAIGGLVAGLCLMLALAGPSRMHILSLWSIVFLVPMGALLRIVQAAIHATGAVTLANAFEQVLRQIAFISAVAVAYSTSPLTTPIVLEAQLAAIAATLILAVVVSKRWYPLAYWKRVGNLRRFPFAEAFSIMGAMSVSILYMRTDLLMLGMQLGPGDVADYKIAVRLAEIAGFPVAAMVAVLAPRVSRLGQGRTMGSMFVTATPVVFVLAATLATIIYTFRTTLVGVFGESYIHALAPLGLLLLAQLAYAIFGVSQVLLSFSGNSSVALRAQAVGLLLNIGLNLALVGPLGTRGAAIGTLAALATSGAIMTASLWRTVSR